jgi:hypothetical protein
MSDNLEVKIGRLTRKLAKMKDQRDKARADLAHYAKVISMQPYLESRYNSYEERVAERQRVKDLEARVKEQAALILQLQKEIARLETMPKLPFPYPSPSMPYQPFKGCPVCDIGADGGAIGYVCNRTDCPSAIRC